MKDIASVGFLTLSLMVGLFLLGSWIFMLIWNAILPNLFNFPMLTFWQAAGIKFMIGGLGTLNLNKNKKVDD